MRPYLAIIKDSFRAAMASRVLYVLLLLITVLLLALAPLHMNETLDWQLSRDFNVRNPEVVLRQIVNNKDSKPASRVWELLPERTRSKMEKTIKSADESGGTNKQSQSVEEIFLQEDMIKQLNLIIENPEFYRAEDWTSSLLPTEAQEYIDNGVESLTDVRSKRLNRLLLAKAFPGIDQGNASALMFKYAIWEFPAPLSMTHEQFAQTLTSQLPWYFEKLVLSIGLLIAIIVTANMIPETFEPGSLNLLLSKPISRWGLFVAKFVGGCVFIALCAAYLFAGLWTWLGLGMGVWDRAILFSIPLYVVVFAIYFSVSAVVGLIWRSAIVSVILTLMFWAFCFTIGTVFYRFDTKMQNSELIDLLPVGEQVYPSDMLHQVLAWDAAANQWQVKDEAGLGAEGKIQFGINSFFVSLRDIPAMPGLGSHLAPIHDADSSRIIASRFELGNSFTSGRKKMLVADDSDNLIFKTVGDFPRDTVRIFKSKRGVVAADLNGFFHLLNAEALESTFGSAPVSSADSDKPDKPSTNRSTSSDSPRPGPPQVSTSAIETESADTDSAETDSDEIQDEKASAEADVQTEDSTTKNDPVPDSKAKVNLWTRIGPKFSSSIDSAHHVGYSRSRDEFAVYRRGELKIFRFQEAVEESEDQPAQPAGYVVHATLPLSLEFDKGMTSRMEFAGETIMLAFGNGKVITVDAGTLKEKSEYQPENRTAIESVSASVDGRYFASLYRNGNLWLLDTKNDARMNKARVKGQGDVCAFAFGENNDLWVTENTDRVYGYNLENNTSILRRVPTGTWVERLYRLALRPFYQACPKPGEFYKVVAHLSSSGDTEANVDVDMNKTLQSADPWSPLWSGLGFMFAMLFLGCVIFQFKDY